MTPTQRTLKALREAGYHAAIVEHWNPHARIRQDLFGFGDILAIKPLIPPMIVQTTTGSGHAARVSKILGLPLARLWLETGGTIQVISWTKKGPRGKRKVWTARAEQIHLTAFASAYAVADAALP